MTKMNNVGKSLIILLVLYVSGFLPARSQDVNTEFYSASDTLEDFGLFSSDEILGLSLRFDITNYLRNKPKDEYLDAVLTYHINDKDSVNKEIRLKSRGEFRNGYCSFPPILLNFKKTEFGKNDLARLEKMKLVTHCMNGNEDYVFREFLTYKLYNVLTDTSFRVRLVKINYINTHKKSKPVSSYAFFIEPLDFLAERINSIPVELNNLTQRNIDRKMMDRMAIFNYMIGNYDWSVPNQHNCKILTPAVSLRADAGFIVPYDFDYSGLVNAQYAVPPEGLGITSVRQRIYLGICRNEEIFRKALDEFKDKKQAFYKIISGFQYLDERSRKDMIKFLDGFFNEIENEDIIIRDFLKNCKKL
jgi:hypothetical protein